MIKNADKNRFWSKTKINKSNGCIEWQGQLDKDGYGKFQITIEKRKQKHFRAHRFVWQIFNDNTPKLLLHTCDNRKCVNISHLKEGSQLDNIKDAKDKNRRAEAERHPLSKLSKKDVIEIRTLRRQGLTQIQLSSMFNISRSTIANILINNVWNYPDCFPKD